MTLPPSTVESLGWRRNPRIEEAPLQRELMLFDPLSSKFFVLNRTMAFLWQRCDGERSMAAIAADLVGAFSGIEPAQAEADLCAALQELVDLGLLIRP